MVFPIPLEHHLEFVVLSGTCVDWKGECRGSNYIRKAFKIRFAEQDRWLHSKEH